MKGIRFGLVVALAVIPFFVLAQNSTPSTATAPQQNPTTTEPSSNQGDAPMASNGSIKILSPKVDEKLGSTIVTVRFQLDNAGLSADTSPNFRVQLDSREAVETTSTEQSFTGLTPGDHVVTIDLVDANHNPIPQGHVEVRFHTFTPGPDPSQQTGALVAPSVVKASLPLPDNTANDELPSAAGNLPLLSMVGFGVLVGGVISAMRTRR